MTSNTVAFLSHGFIARRGDANSILRPVLGLGTAINVVAVLIGGGIGTLAGARLPEGMRVTAIQAIGIVTLLVGVANFLKFATEPAEAVSRLTFVRVQ